MKIDIHAHTKKCKSGDAPTREITPAAFCEKIQSTDVGIIAITNHNFFDLCQFLEIVDLIGSDAQVWPGVELDVQEGGGRGHIIVIVSPKEAKGFHEVISELTNNSTPDSFKTTIEQVLKTFEDFKPLYVTHYKQKTPNISDESLEKLTSGIPNPERVIIPPYHCHYAASPTGAQSPARQADPCPSASSIPPISTWARPTAPPGGSPSVLRTSSACSAASWPTPLPSGSTSS